MIGGDHGTISGVHGAIADIWLLLVGLVHSVVTAYARRCTCMIEMAAKKL